MPGVAAGLQDAGEQVAAVFEAVGVFGAPVGGKGAGDGGLEHGLAVAGQQRLRVAQRGFALVQPGEQGFDLLDDAALFVEGRKWELKFCEAIELHSRPVSRRATHREINEFLSVKQILDEFAIEKIRSGKHDEFCRRHPFKLGTMNLIKIGTEAPVKDVTFLEIASCTFHLRELVLTNEVERVGVNVIHADER